MMQTSTSGDVPKPYDEELTRGMGWRVMASIVGGTAWVIFFLLFVAFVPTGFILSQSIVVIIVATLAITAILGATWASYGMRHAELGGSCR
jgi:hypothetical protein